MKKIYSFDGNVFYHATWEDRSATQQYRHSIIFPKNTYSPWEQDTEFRDVYLKIKEHYTLVDEFRCYELWSVAKQLDAQAGDIIEVGVWRGGTGAILAKAVSSDTIVYLCDTFEGVVKASEKDATYKGGEHSDTNENIVETLMEQLDIKNFRIVKGIFPDEGVEQIKSDKIKLCHIDVDVYESAKDIFNWVWPQVVTGGAVIFDDYGFAACEGITALVNELKNQLNDAFFVYNINGHGLLVKVR